MNEMAKHPRLHRVGSTYYLRAAIPADIKDSYPKSVIKFSLGTKDYQEAVKRLRTESVRVDNEFEAFRKKESAINSPAQDSIPQSLIDRIAAKHKHWLMQTDEQIREHGFYLDGVSYKTYVNANEGFTKQDKLNYAQGIVPEVYIELAETLLADEGVRLKKSSASLRKLSRELMAVSIEGHIVFEKRNQGEVVRTPELFIATNAPSAKQALSEVFIKWLDELKQDTGLQQGTLDDKAEALGLYIETVGNLPYDQYTKEHVRDFKRVLSYYPANKNKRKPYRDMSAREASKVVKENGAISISNTTKRKYMGNLMHFWSWLSRNYDVANIFDRMNFSKTNEDKQQRLTFSDQDIKALLSTPLYQGCVSHSKWKEHGDNIPKESGRYWVLLIALYTGARIEEICQLYTEDVKALAKGDFYYFDFNDDGDDKKIKTGSKGRKLVPVHNKLVELGFIDFLEKREVAGELRLFPELKKQSGKYSRSLGRFYNEKYFKFCGLDSRGQVFHCFRHTFIDATRRAGIPREIAVRFTGHTLKDKSAFDDYGNEDLLLSLNSHLQTIQFELPEMP